jgi:hypothetical protein
MCCTHDCYLQSTCVTTCFLLISIMMSPAVLLRGFSNFTQSCMRFSLAHP